MIKAQSPARDIWGIPWTGQMALAITLAFAAMFLLEFPFIFFFDARLTHNGFMYVYFWALPQAVILYFVAFRLRVPWTATVLMGLSGIIGALVDYYFEWVMAKVLLSPVYAFAYIPLYLLVGLVADVSLMLLRPQQQPLRAALLSSFVFTASVLTTTIFATFVFYPVLARIQDTWLGYAGFLVPYALITGTMGGYLGFSIATDMNRLKT